MPKIGAILATEENSIFTTRSPDKLYIFDGLTSPRSHSVHDSSPPVKKSHLFQCQLLNFVLQVTHIV